MRWRATVPPAQAAKALRAPSTTWYLAKATRASSTLRVWQTLVDRRPRRGTPADGARRQTAVRLGRKPGTRFDKQIRQLALRLEPRGGAAGDSRRRALYFRGPQGALKVARARQCRRRRDWFCRGATAVVRHLRLTATRSEAGEPTSLLTRRAWPGPNADLPATAGPPFDRGCRAGVDRRVVIDQRDGDIIVDRRCTAGVPDLVGRTKARHHARGREGPGGRQIREPMAPHLLCGQPVPRRPRGAWLP